jgi:hypothetical protein
MKRVFYYSVERLLMTVFDTGYGHEKVCAICPLQIVYLQEAAVIEKQLQYITICI